MTRRLGGDSGAGDEPRPDPRPASDAASDAAAGRAPGAGDGPAADSAGRGRAAGNDPATDPAGRRRDSGAGRRSRGTGPARRRSPGSRGLASRLGAAVSRLATRWTAAAAVVVATILAGVFATPLGSAPGVVALLAVLIMVLAMLATSRSRVPAASRYGPGLRRVAAAPPVVIAQTDPDAAARPRPRAPSGELVPLSCPSTCSRSEGSRHVVRSRHTCPGRLRSRPRPLLRCGAARR